MKKTKWLKRHQPNADNIVVRNNIVQLMDEWSICERTAELLSNREVGNISQFMHPTAEILHDPFLFKDMGIAVERIKRAIANHEKITVYGDYDVDGVMATTIILTYFKGLGYDNIFYYIPRREEGYGPNCDAFRSIAENGTSLIITVDCGITALNEVALANELGVDVIVTDHHEQMATLPAGVAVIDPKCHDSGYPFPGLCGAGVAYKVMLALHASLEQAPTCYLADLSDFYDFVAVATVADIVPLTDENRYLVMQGLKTFNPSNDNKRATFEKLLEVSGLLGRKISAMDVGFQLAPRINAVGRLEDASLAVEYFTNTDEENLTGVARSFDDYNNQRKLLEKEAVARILYNMPSVEEYEDFTIVVEDPYVKTGIKGLVASTIQNMYHRPTIIFNKSADGTYWEGSGRSIEGLDMKKSFDECAETLMKYGGHTMAGGLSVKDECLAEFKEQFETVARKYLGQNDLVPCFYYDSEVCAKDITSQLIRDTELLSPFGEGNESPLFVCNNATILEKAYRGKNLHLYLKITLNGVNFECIGWNMGNLYNELSIGENIDLLFEITENVWQGITKIQLSIKDLRPTEPEGTPIAYREVIHDKLFFADTCPVKENQQLIIARDKNDLVHTVEVFTGAGKHIGGVSLKIAAKLHTILKKHPDIYFKVLVDSVEFIDNQYQVSISMTPKVRV